MRALAFAALAACSFPRPPDVAGDASTGLDVVGPPPQADAAISPSDATLAGFQILASVNTTIAHDLSISQVDKQIDVFAFEPPDTLIPSFDAGGGTVMVGSTLVASGTTPVTFAPSATLEVTSADGTTRATYTVTMHPLKLTPGMPTPLIVNTTPISMAVGDIDHDGYPDVVVGDGGSGNYVYVYMNNKAGGFTYAIMVPTSASPRALALIDLDNDGYPELIAGSTGSAKIAVHHNTTAPAKVAFGGPVNYAAGTGTAAIAGGSIATTGRDVVTAYVGADVLPDTSNLGAPALGTAMPLVVGGDSNAAAVALVDWDGDGKLDIALANQGTNNVRILTSRQGYALTSTVDLTSLASPVGLAVGDFDHDGHADLAIATSTVTGLEVELGGHDSRISKHADLAGLPSCVAAVDLDGDQHADLVATTLRQGTLSEVEAVIYGDLRLSQKQEASIAARPVGCAVADVDANGAPVFVTVTGSNITTVRVKP